MSQPIARNTDNVWTYKNKQFLYSGVKTICCSLHLISKDLAPFSWINQSKKGSVSVRIDHGFGTGVNLSDAIEMLLH